MKTQRWVKTNISNNIKLYTYEEVFHNTGDVDDDSYDRLRSHKLAKIKFRQIAKLACSGMHP